MKREARGRGNPRRKANSEQGQRTGQGVLYRTVLYSLAPTMYYTEVTPSLLYLERERERKRRSRDLGICPRSKIGENKKHLRTQDRYISLRGSKAAFDSFAAVIRHTFVCPFCLALLFLFLLVLCDLQR